jgi:CheY-like chemotaxis protein
MVGTPPRVLVVDDAESVRALITLNLELEGFEVTCAEDGQEALEVVGEVDPQVITLDVWMPRLGGFDTLKRLRANPRTRDIPVVLVTAQATAADRDRAAALGVDGYLTKPFEPAELVEVVTRLARTGRREAGGADTLSE